MYSQYDNSEDFPLGSSPPCGPVIPECSDLFKAVMDDLIQDKRRYSADTQKRTRSMFDACEPRRKSSATTSSTNVLAGACKRCQTVRSNCRCGTHNLRRRGSIHRVQWVDESCDKPLAAEYVVSDDDTDSIGRSSPLMEGKDYIKPILKQKANCIIIVSES